MEDDACVRAYLKGDPSAFETIYSRYRDRLYGYVMRNCKSEDVADEVFQEIWLKVLVSLDRYRGKGRFRSWLFVCAHNVIIDRFRKRVDTPLDPAEADLMSVSPDMTAVDLASRIEAALMTLPVPQRQAFYLREELGCSIKDIAEIQDCSVEAAKSRLRYAYTKLKAELHELKPQEYHHAV